MRNLDGLGHITAAWLEMCAIDEHRDDDEITIEIRDGQWIVAGAASFPSWNSARELIIGEAA